MIYFSEKNFLSALTHHYLTVFLILLLTFFLSIFPKAAPGTDRATYISTEKIAGAFTLSTAGKSAPLCASSQDFPGVIRVLKLLQADIERVTNEKPDVIIDAIPATSEIVLIGTLGKNPLIDRLVADKKLEVNDIAGKWEASLIQIISNPFPNVALALVIVGSDKRGTIFGMFDLSEKIDVSPWYWWADVPAKKKSNIFIRPGRYTFGEPKVKYRGIFINDEAPALSGWAYEKFGGFNAKFYDHVFELILRLKGNFLWPAMWGRAFYDDDPENPRLADEYGVVIGTSHHEPMMRAHDEWRRYGSGPWNYEKNEAKLREFWTEGIRRMGNYESIVTLAMRGDGDEPMTESANIELLQRIVKDQREILKEVTGKDVTTIPQVWALYKEVQEYYDRGMRVPDDVTLLLCDDNWGNVRILPKKEDQDRTGGFGIYYHFDYVGGPISYKWLNVTQIEKVWEQMNLAYQWGARKLWLVNVGDIKPMELPISFFLDFAWNPEAIHPKDLPQYYVDWAQQQFGEKYAKEIGKILSLFTKYNARRHPEMLEPFTYSLMNYREAETVTADYNTLLKKAWAIYEALPESHKSAFYQLVLYPVEACSNLNEMVISAGKNQLYATQGRASANFHAEQVKALFARDAELTRLYHNLENGKWNHMMSQTHIGYTYWNNPPVNKMPAVSYVHVPATSALGYVIENVAGPRFEGSGEPRYSTEMPLFDPVNKQQYCIELFNTGDDPIDYTIKAREDWIKVSSDSGTIKTEQKVYVSIDWKKAPRGRAAGKIVISGPKNKYTINVPIRTDLPDCAGFVENNGVVSIEAAHFDKAVNTADIRWITIPNLGRTLSAVTIQPSNADRQTPGKYSPHLEYTFTLFDASDVKVQTYLSPTLNFMKNEGLKYAIAIDDETPQVVNMHEGETQPDWEYPHWWNTSVADHIKIKATKHKGLTPGKHILKVWMVDPGVVFQKFVIDAGGLKPSYLGPPESFNVTAKIPPKKNYTKGVIMMAGIFDLPISDLPISIIIAILVIIVIFNTYFTFRAFRKGRRINLFFGLLKIGPEYDISERKSSLKKVDSAKFILGSKTIKDEIDHYELLYQKTGIINFFFGQEEMDRLNIWDTIYRNNVSSFDILGHTNEYIKKREDVLINCIQNGGIIRILVLNPVYGSHQQLVETAKLIISKFHVPGTVDSSLDDIIRLHDKIFRTIEFVMNIKKKVGTKNANNIQVRLANSTMYHNITRADNTMCVSHYLSGIREQAQSGPSNILINIDSNDLSRNTLFYKHLQEFNNLWEESLPVEYAYKLKNMKSQLKEFITAIINAYIAFSQGKPELLPFPVFAIVFPTYSCNKFGGNRACSYCSFNGFGTKHISIDKFEKVVNFLCLSEPGPKIKFLELSGGGEPTEHPEFFKILKILDDLRNSRSDLVLGLLTNGLYIPKKNYSKFSIFNYIRVNLPEYLYLTNSENKIWKSYIDNLKYMRESCPNSRMGIKLLVTIDNITYIPKLVEYFFSEKILGVHHIKIKAVRANNLRPTNTQLDLLADEICVLRTSNKYKDLVVDFPIKNIPNSHICWISPIFTVIDPNCQTYKCCNISRFTPNPPILLENLSYENYQEYKRTWKSFEHMKIIKNLDVHRVCNLPNAADCRFFEYQNFIHSYINTLFQNDRL